uniref:Uncharacterized protein n=1 Tax=Anguilla anguilla TaxID=7936 RepID=A0A0E9W4E2_ANGAN
MTARDNDFPLHFSLNIPTKVLRRTTARKK